MKTLEAIFDNIGRAITSLAAVIFVMLMTITGMIFFSHTLFSQVFPAGMAEWERLVATWLMALGWEFTVLITTCNTRHINHHLPVVMAIASGIIVLFFIQAFDTTQTSLILAQRWFIGVLAATINYIYAELFYAKWKERQDSQELPARLAERERTLIEMRAEADRDINQLQSKLDQAHAELDDVRSKLEERGRSVVELERFKTKIDRDLTCPHCKLVQESYGILQAHKGHCTKNPNKRGARQVNGNPTNHN
jgi:hypothetical protein